MLFVSVVRVLCPFLSDMRCTYTRSVYTVRDKWTNEFLLYYYAELSWLFRGLDGAEFAAAALLL